MAFETPSYPTQNGVNSAANCTQCKCYDCAKSAFAGNHDACPFQKCLTCSGPVSTCTAFEKKKEQ